MTRIIGGSARGRRLVVPDGGTTRPTSSRAREALFSSVESERGAWQGAAFLDLYAGSGAVGLEAASRGAAPVVLVESERAAWHACRENLATLGLRGVTLHRMTVESFLRDPANLPRQPFDVVFADPPYALADAELAPVLAVVAGPDWCAAGALVVVERGVRGEDPPWPASVQPLRSRRYGDAMLWYGRALRA